MSDPREERRFLHDIASPLSAAIFNLDILLETTRESADKANLPQLESMQRSLEKIRVLLQDRRAILIQRSSESGSDKPSG